MDIFRFDVLDTGNAWIYAPLTYVTYRAKLMRADPRGNILAVGASLEGRPAGLALAEQRIGNCSMLSLMVQEEFKGMGLGTQLLERMEALAAQAGSRMLRADFADGKDYTPAIRRILEKGQWSVPATKSNVYRCSTKIDDRKDFPWWLDYRPEGLAKAVVPWNTLAQPELDKLRAAEWLPKGLSPFEGQEQIEDRYSLAFRSGDEVTGWIIYHKIRGDTTVCRSLFVREDLRDQGHAAFLVIRSIQLQYDNGIENFMFTIHNGNEHVLPMIRRWMGKYIVSSVRWLQSEKELKGWN